MTDKKSVQLDPDTHRSLKLAATEQGLSIERLVHIIVNVALLGLPAILKKWSRSGGDKHKSA